MTTTEVQTEIAQLEARRAVPGRHPTEIYTRIVGYYRSLANWNAGKREEYAHRVTFSEALAAKPHVREATLAHTWLVFVKDNCPQCPPLKAQLPKLALPGTTYDVVSDSGFEAAVQWQVTATPTLILLDDGGAEICRISSASDWNQLTPHLGGPASH